ncbi:synaptotagmin-5-like isoform X1 [Typha latifolia]|uniref:synaptotagmin-5-like isoform X1 n=2 Tax=Typha latifolia TaxID=4733 RepID=UPI003C304692
MAFFLGLVLGVAFGIGVVIAFARSENSRSRRRRELAAAVASFSKMTVEDSRKILPADLYPSWVVFSRRQKLKWLNQELIKVWPFVDKAASELIKSSVEPILEQYRSGILASLKFSKLTLGTVAPQFTGVSIIEEESEDASGITMELDLNWDANPNIVLDIRTTLGVALPIQVKDIGFTGVFRLMFKPLVEQFPCFGAICYSLREKKKLDFKLKVVGGEVSSIPGISDAIEETIRVAIEDSLTWPVRKVVPILPGDYSDLELKPVGILEVKLVQARDLTNKDLVGKSDPFAVLYIRPLRDRMKTSKIINNDLNPIWNEHFEFVVEDADTQNLVVKIYDDDGIQASELIGCAHVRLKDLQPGKVKDIWLKLVKDLEVQRDKKDRGQVHLELLYCPYGTEDEFSNPFAKQFSMTSLEKTISNRENGNGVTNIDRLSSRKRKEVIMRGVLSVTVISAQDLPAMDINGKSDPYVVINMKKMKTKAKTRVVSENLNPTWNQTFEFVVEDSLHELLILEVWDHDTFGQDYIGRCITTLTRVIMEEEYTESFPIEEAKSGKLNLRLKWSPQPIYRES